MSETFFFTAEEVAEILRVTKRTITNMATAKEIPGARKFGNLWRFGRTELEDFLGRKLPDPREMSKNA